MTSRPTSARHRGRAEPNPEQAWLAAVADAAAAAAGTPVELLGQYLTILADAAVSGRRPQKRELEAVRELGRRAAEQGVSAGQAVDLYLSAAWRLWRELPMVVRTRDRHKVRAAAEAVLRVIDDAVEVLVDGHQLARRDMVRREEALRREVPLLGVCLGAQLMARALGVPVVRARRREFGFVPIRLTEAGSSDPLLSAFASGVHVFQWHEDTFDLPPGAHLLATGDEVRVQACRVGRRAWGVQFHPEMTEPEIEGWLADTGPGLARSWGKSAGQIRAELAQHLPDQQARGRELFRRFARLVGERAAAEGRGEPAEARGG